MKIADITIGDEYAIGSRDWHPREDYRTLPVVAKIIGIERMRKARWDELKPESNVRGEHDWEQYIPDASGRPYALIESTIREDELFDERFPSDKKIPITRAITLSRVLRTRAEQERMIRDYKREVAARRKRYAASVTARNRITKILKERGIDASVTPSADGGVSLHTRSIADSDALIELLASTPILTR